MRRSLLFLSLLFCHWTFAQFGAKVILFRPTAELGMVIKPTVSGELVYKTFNDDSNLQLRVSLGFIKGTPRMEVFPVNGLIISNSTTVVPGTMEFTKYNIMYLSPGVDYHFNLNDAFSFYTGGDINIGGVNQEYQARYELISEEGYSGGDPFIGIRPRLGMEFKTDKFGIFFEANRNMNLIPQQAFINYNDYGIGIRFNFDN